jgi:nuclear GTP-binding protein
VAHIVSRADTEDLMLFYNLPAFSKGDTDAFLSGLARSNGMVKKVRVYLLSSEADGV